MRSGAVVGAALATDRTPMSRTVRRLRWFAIVPVVWVIGASRCRKVGMGVRLFTIGFAETSASEFFTRLREAGVKRVVDVRLNNTSQLAGFTKRDDLRFFLREVGGIDYVHVPELAPTPQIFEAFKKHKGSWTVFEREFNALMAKRAIEKVVTREMMDMGCLLCSEKEPHMCHRRLVAAYLEKKWGKGGGKGGGEGGGVETEHLE